MTAKLTLRVNALLIQQAKVYAKDHEKSVSQMVGDFFALLSTPVKHTSSPALPLTRSLRGVLKKTNLSKNDYHQYLDEKYL